MNSKSCWIRTALAVTAVTILLATTVADAEKAEFWSATLQVEGEQVESAMYQDEAVIGESDMASQLPKSPAPPEYTVYLQLWRLDWSGPWYQDIRQDGEAIYHWIVDLNPHGNMPPPGDRCATLCWDPDQFATSGTYVLREGYEVEGPVAISDMRTDTSIVVCGGNSPHYFVIEYTPATGPNIDSVHFYISHDANGDGIAALGDSLTIIGWALSNPAFLVDSMISDLHNFGMGFVTLDEVMDSNRIFKRRIALDVALPIDIPASDPGNRIWIYAFGPDDSWDMDSVDLDKAVDVDPPVFSGVSYVGHGGGRSCIGIDDSVHISADLSGALDVDSVWVNPVDAGLGGSSGQPLYDDGDPIHGDAIAGDGILNLLWRIAEPPIEDGKDANNSAPPPTDDQYRVVVHARDDAGNTSSVQSGDLDATLDTRRPRAVCWNDPDSLHLKQHSGDSIIMIYWDRDFDENDAIFFFVYVDSGEGYDWDNPMGSTFDGENPGDFNLWISPVLTGGKDYYFKTITKDDCDNLGSVSTELLHQFSGVEDRDVDLTKPDRFVLFQNYPNPFNPETQLEFFLPRNCYVELCIYDILGRKVKTLLDQNLGAGLKLISWDGKDEEGEKVASGVYFYRIQAGDLTDSKKMVLMK